MVAVVLADDRLLTWRASTDDAKAVLWDAAGGRVVAALQHLSKIDGAVPVAPQNILTWPRAHRGLYRPTMSASNSARSPSIKWIEALQVRLRISDRAISAAGIPLVILPSDQVSLPQNPLENV